MTLPDRISIDPKVMGGKPVVRGTRLTVEHVVGLLADGWSEQQVLEQHPNLRAEDIRACLDYARRLLADERTFPLSA